MSAIVIVGVDGSETAERAAVRAGELAVALDAELRLVCVFEKLEVERVDIDTEEFFFATDEDARATADKVARAVRADVSGVNIVTQAVQGKPAAALVELAESTEAVVIVVGNKRVQGVARVLGSIATDVTRKAPCDVYIAHTHDRRKH